MVVRLAESLELTLRDRNNLLLAAGFAPVFPESDLAAPELAAVREALTAVLDGHLPYPALVARPRGELVTANTAFDLFTEGVADHLLRAPMNVLRLALHPDGVAPRVRNLPEWGRHIIDSLRSRAAHTPDPAVDALIEELSGYLPSVAVGPDHVGFAVPLHLRTDDGDLRLITTLTSFATATDVTLAELHLEAFLPADEESARILRLRASRR
ncbi:MmyB family transcriptional regulator [Nocardia sp. JW2]|uniref:MmyB family transcriptional regulator n=1 Tax=Nocardia sp. JW2 TaxID=3450738 RepID=UPI003F41D484